MTPAVVRSRCSSCRNEAAQRGQAGTAVGLLVGFSGPADKQSRHTGQVSWVGTGGAAEGGGVGGGWVV